MGLEDNRDFMAALTSLIDQWCEQRRYPQLAALLPSVVAFNGLTDGWQDLRSGLRSAVGLGGDGLPDSEWQMLQHLSRDADNRLAGR